MKRGLKLILPILLFLSMFFTSCNSKLEVKKESNIEKITEANLEELSKYKDSYVGDNSAVGGIIAKLPGNVYFEKFSLKTDEKPYEINISYDTNKNLGTTDYTEFWKTHETDGTLRKNASIIFSLVKNVDIVTFKLNNFNDKTYSYKREDFNK